MSNASPRWLSIAGLGALVAINVVLIALLLVRPSSTTVAEQGAPPRANEPAGNSEELTKREPEVFAARETEEDDLKSPKRLIVNADATVAWRATVGSCADTGTLERTIDAGETWEVLPLDLAPVSRMRVLGTQSLFVIGGGVDCEPTYRSSSTAGESWTTNDQFLEGSWFVVPADRQTLATPVGEVAAPCSPTDLAALDASNAAVLCTDGSLALTNDGGATWTPMASDLDAMALGVAENGYALAGALDACDDDVAIGLVDPAAQALAQTSCIAVSVNEAGLAVSALGGAVWLWAGDEVLASSVGAA